MQMDVERIKTSNDPKPQVQPQARGKTSLRLRYEAEVKVLRAQLGSIEDIRLELGLSQRKICQLLMVDPSTWTRWLKDENQGKSKVPPHIYRAFQWYLQLIEKRPEWHPQQSFRPLSQGFLSQNSHTGNIEDLKQQLEGQNFQFEQQLRDLTDTWRAERENLLKKIEKKDMALAGWKLFVLLNSLALFLLWFFN